MSDQSRSTLRTFLPATIAIVLVAGLRLLPLAFPEARLWGIDSFRYLHPVIVAMATLLLLVFALPQVQTRIAALVADTDDKRWRTRTNILVGALLAAALFFPMRTFFYGDGGTLVTALLPAHSTSRRDNTAMLRSMPRCLINLENIVS